MIIGIHGRAQCGKDTLARALAKNGGGTNCVMPDQHESLRGGCDILHFADALWDVVQAAFGSRYETAEEKAAVDPFWQERIGSGPFCTSEVRGPDDYGPGGDLGPRRTFKEVRHECTGRHVLQRVGTELFRNHVHQDFWLFAMEHRIGRISMAEHTIIADVRFENEARWVIAHGGVMIGLARSDQPPLPPDAHASEQPIAWEHLHERHRCDSAEAVRTLGAVLARKYLN